MEINRRLFTRAQASAEAGKFAWYKKRVEIALYPAKLRRRPQPPPKRHLFSFVQTAGHQTEVGFEAKVILI